MKIKFLLLPAMSLFLMFASCKKDSGSNNNPNPNPPPSTPTVDANESLNNKLTANSWTLTSFTANGVEQIGSTYSSVTGTFQKEDKNNGSYSFIMINMNGATTPDNGKYLIRNNGTEIEMGGDILGITVGTNLVIEGNYQGIYVKITAKK